MDRQLVVRPDINKRTALHLAASNDLLGETVQYLVQEGLMVTQGDAKKVTPLHLACLSGLSVAVSAMLDALSTSSIISTAVNTADAMGGFAQVLAGRAVAATIAAKISDDSSSIAFNLACMLPNFFRPHPAALCSILWRRQAASGFAANS